MRIVSRYLMGRHDLLYYGEMRGWLLYCLTILLFATLACLIYWLYQPIDANSLLHVLFPVPTSFALLQNNQVTTLDTWTVGSVASAHDTNAPNVSATFDYAIPATATHKAFYMENETNLISSYPGVKGVKTGYTPEAGLCLVTYLEYNGHQIIGVVLNSDDRRDDMKDLLDYSLKKEGITPPRHG